MVNCVFFVAAGGGDSHAPALCLSQPHVFFLGPQAGKRDEKWALPLHPCSRENDHEACRSAPLSQEGYEPQSLLVRLSPLAALRRSREAGMACTPPLLLLTERGSPVGGSD